MSKSLWNRLLFNTTSAAYDALTGQDVWRSHVARVLDHVPDSTKLRRVLDVGCGPGVSAFGLAQLLPDATIDGLDLAEKMIARAKAHHTHSYPALSNVKFHVGDATRLSWPDETFDLIVGHSFLYLVPDPATVLAEARRALTPGGTLVLLEPNRTGSLRRAHISDFGLDLTDHTPLDVARFRLSMVAWRVVSGNVGRLDPAVVVGWLARAGFDECHTAPTLGGLGMHCVGRAP